MGFFTRNKDVSNLNIPELPPIPEMPSLPELPPMPESRKDMQPLDSPSYNSQIPVLKSNNIPPREKPSTLSSPVFVKLEKFKEALTNFEEIKTKVNDIDNSLRKLKEVRQKEENEILGWEEELRIIKEKASSIDNSLFNKI